MNTEFKTYPYPFLEDLVSLSSGLELNIRYLTHAPRYVDSFGVLTA